VRRRWLVVFVALGCGPADDATLGAETDATTAPPPTSSTASGPTSTGQRWEQTLGCGLWLDCLDEQERDALMDEFGPEGTCWQGNARLVEECDAMCTQGREDDCDDPVEDTGPVPDFPADVDECSLQVLAPGAQSWVIAGDGAGVLPHEIGSILERNCSCHVTDPQELMPLTPLYEGAIRFTTHEEFHADWMGSPVHAEVEQRTFVMLSMPPLYFCGDGDYGSSVHSPDFEIFAAWLAAAAPDAATWAELRPDDLP
jgi:hypothetical protein